jgi:hypothetical protein
MALGNLSFIKLWPLGDSDHLAIGEGIETTLAAVELGLVKPPAWSATVAFGLTQLPIIKQVKRLVVLVDNDEIETGLKAARKLRNRYITKNKRVDLLMPAKVGTDFNDVLIERKFHGRR